MNKIPLLVHDNKVALHRQAEEDLRKLVKHTDFSNGGLFPKEADLAQRWEIARNTLRQEISKLMLESFRSTGKLPMVYFESHIHPKDCLSEKENFENPLYELLHRDHDIMPVYCQEKIKAIAASFKITALLLIKQGTLALDSADSPLNSISAFTAAIDLPIVLK